MTHGKRSKGSGSRRGSAWAEHSGGDRRVRLSTSVKYRGTMGRVRWEGHVVQDAERFQDYMRHVVAPRLTADSSRFATVVRGLALTEMATDAVGRLLDSVRSWKGWEVGETLAECVLGDDMDWQVHWPWDTSRDLRSPNASLQGADLVGFVRRDGKTFLLFGEVKTSGETRTPPTVMTGRSGLPSQLKKISLRPDVQCALVSWLEARCQSQVQRDLFEKATRRYLESGGQSFVLAGVLLRDTTPNERDLRRPAEALSRQLAAASGSVDLVAWYLPTPIDRWPTLVGEPT